MEEELDIMQLAALTAAASSAANSTAYSVDAVVKEAVLFFATMPSASSLNRKSTDSNEEVFKQFGRKAHSDSCSAAEACAEAHQLVTRDSAQLAVLAASRVGMFAARTAATAREAAQLCMGILEEAVQANAGPLARETAKRCAEQALHSVEAASVAEMHSCSLREKLEKIAQVSQAREPGLAQIPDSSTVPSSSSEAARMGRTSALSAHSPEAPTTGGSRGSRRPIPKARRWWQDGFPNFSGDVTSSRPALTMSMSPLAVDSPALQEANTASAKVAEHLKSCASHCFEEVGASGTSDRDPSDSAEDLQAMRVIVDWRYGLASARSCREDEVLSDMDVARLATWRPSPPAEAVLIPELVQAVQRHGADASDALHRSLNHSTRDRKEVNGGANGEQLQATTIPQDWEAAFDGLGWIQLQIDHRRTDSVAYGSGLIAADLVTDTAATSMPIEDSWSVDDMTLWHLHVMSMHSRHKQRRAGGAKHKEAALSSSTAPEPASSNSVVEQDSEIDLRVFLHDVLGGWEVPHEEQEFHSSLGSAAAPKRNSRKKKKIGAPPPPGPPGTLTSIGGAPATFQATSQMHWGMEQNMHHAMPMVPEQMVQRSQRRDSNGMPLGGSYTMPLAPPGHMAHSFQDNTSVAFGHQGNQFFRPAWPNGSASKDEDPSLPVYVQVSRIPGDGLI